MKTVNLTKWMQCALMAALTGILSQIVIPIGPVPINLATFAVFLSGGLLGRYYGALSMALYLLLGLAGMPVFTMMRGGVGVLVGPTGGYLLGYVAAAWIIGILTSVYGHSLKALIPSMILGMASYFVSGTTWFMLSTGSGIRISLMTCVVPFLPGDALKIAMAAVLVRRLHPILSRYTMSVTRP